MDPELIEGHPAEPVVETPAAAPAPAEPEQSPEAAALAAMDEALAPAVDATTPAVVEPAKPAEPAAAAAPAAAPIPGTPEAAAAELAAAEAAKTAPDATTEAEIAALGLKEGKSSDRFREMAGEIKSFAPVKEALEKAGVKDVAELPQIIQHANDYRELVGMVQDTGATPEQYGMTLDYLKVINAANSGDRAAAERAYEMVSGELAQLAKLIGKEVPGLHDPLADHPDLQQQINMGEISRPAALELASLRQANAMDSGRRQIESQRNNAQSAQQQGIDGLNALGGELSTDPQYQQKAPVLVAALRAMQRTTPPSQWVATAREIYASIPAMAAPAPAPAAAPAPARVTPGPVRGNTVRPALAQVTDDPFEAMEQGIAAANGG
ncbi:hypothetical protein EAH88_11830 [Rhodanobacter glycinis]|uniref:Uncharacterized protein n=1 Tax=Rhodanobacter glycinis TaxID=582702 RepID=A0A502C465_9GAMM|nr:hypothetical protein [Rhodanobacter glycinis]TPG08315.1 hypothetical protein EAH88_11830 [Rhodanobacter glycinis]